MTYQVNVVKDAEAESAILRKRPKEVEEGARKARKLLSKCSVARKKLEDQISDLKHFLVMARADSLKSK